MSSNKIYLPAFLNAKVVKDKSGVCWTRSGYAEVDIDEYSDINSFTIEESKACCEDCISIIDIDYPTFALDPIEIPDIDIELPPVIEIPSFDIPSFDIPSFDIPSFEIPSFEIPSFEIPSFEIPSFEIPSFEIPSFEIP